MLAHTSALTMMRSYAGKSSDSTLRRMAASSAPIIERHLQTARQLLQSFMQARRTTVAGQVSPVSTSRLAIARYS